MLAALLAILVYLLALRAMRSRDQRLEQVRRAAIVDGSAESALAHLNATLEQQVADRTARLDAALRDLRNIVDALPSMIGYWGSDLVNRVANRAYAHWFGLVPEAMNGRPMRDVLGEQAFERTRPYVEAVLRGVPQTYPRSIVGPDGQELRHLVVHYLPDTVEGHVRGFYVLVQDLTELTESRLKLAAAQRDNQALLQTIQQHAIVSVTDRAGRIIDVSESFCRISGYGRDELIGQTHRLINSGEHGRAFWIDVWRTVSSGDVWRGEICNRAKDGSLYWVDSIISPFLGPDGKIDKYISIRTDVTARKRAETELLETSSLLTAVLAAASDVSIIATDVAGAITLFNRGAERLLGYHQAELVGRSTPAVFHLDAEVAARGAHLSAAYGEDIAGFRTLVHEPEHHGPESREWTYVRKDGGHVPVALTVSAMRDNRGQLFGYLGVAHDVSRQKQHERSLRDAVDRAERANEAKSQFLANMSHEIRTPMNAVINLSYLLERTPLDDEQAAFLAKITLASKSLLSIINDVLDLSKIEASELRIERAPFHLGTMLNELSALMTVAAEAKGIDFAIDAAGDLPVTLEGDSTRLHQILTNLLSNAIKFTERGAVGLCVRRLPAADDRVRLRFVVEDSGIGIAPEAMARLFTPFVQADASTTRRFGGTGLGLSIVKQLVRLMDGELGVTSTPGVGSEFWIEIEFASCARMMDEPEAVVTRPALQGLPGVRVLVADDSAMNLEVAKRILELEGASVRLVGNGQEAVDELLVHPSSCDVVLMDIHMPVLDGYDAARRIRSLGLTRLPIIALTAGALTSDRRHAESAGITDFISKPFDPQLLVSRIRRHVMIDDAAEAPARSPNIVLDSWPTIDGIDAADAFRRLGGDVGLFTSMLRRLLDDFSDLDREDVLDTPSLDGLAARMHRLQGSAGTLGARAVHQLAAQVERACRAHHVDQAAQLLLALRQQLHRIARSAAGTLAVEAAVVGDDDPRQEPTLDRAQLVALLALLRQLDLAALDRFSDLSPHLRRVLGKDSYALLHEQIDNLQFGDAARTLESLRA